VLCRICSRIGKLGNSQTYTIISPLPFNTSSPSTAFPISSYTLTVPPHRTQSNPPPAMSQGKLQNKVAIVTGGGGGFGKGIAAEFVKQGASVIIADFVEEVGQKTAGELKCEFVRADVTKREDWEKLVKFADEKFGKLDVVINNAGTTYRNKVCVIIG